MSNDAGTQIKGVLGLLGEALFEGRVPDKLFAGDGTVRAAPSSAPAPATRPPSSQPCERCDGEREVVCKGVVIPCPRCAR